MLPYKLLPPILRFKRDGWNERIYSSVSSAQTIVIFGGYLGDSADLWLKRFPGAKILVFEPVKLFADEIQQRFTATSVEIFNFGISRNGGQRIFQVIGDATFGHTVGRTGQASVAAKSAVVEFRPIGELREILNQQENIDVFEMNIEGGEYELLELLHEERLLANVRKIFVQFHAVGTKTRGKLRHSSFLLSKTHSLTWRYRLVWDLWERHL